MLCHVFIATLAAGMGPKTVASKFPTQWPVFADRFWVNDVKSSFYFLSVHVVRIFISRLGGHHQITRLVAKFLSLVKSSSMAGHWRRHPATSLSCSRASVWRKCWTTAQSFCQTGGAQSLLRHSKVFEWVGIRSCLNFGGHKDSDEVWDQRRYWFRFMIHD